MRIFSLKRTTPLLSLSAFSYLMLLNEQQRSNLSGFGKSVLNSLRASRIFFMCFYDYYSNLPPYNEENKDFYEAEKSKIHDRVAKRILYLSETNRGIYLKAGQYIGNLERIMPKEFTHVLRKLQDSGPALPFTQMKVVIEADLKQHFWDIFEDFDEEAIAAASLAQVHRATLKNEKHEVAVKIQFPYLRTQTFYDLLVLKRITKSCNRLLNWYQSKNLDLSRLFNTFEVALNKELDFTKESNNAKLTKQLFLKDDNVHIPFIYDEYSSNRLITMEFIRNAAKINNKTDIEKVLGLNPMDCADILIDTFGKMIFLHGHIHCDAHPGNILIRKHPTNPKKPQLVLLDHGIYRTLTPEVRVKFCQLWKSLIEFDHDKVHELSKFFQIEEYAHYLPILFLFRTKNSRKIIGAQFTEEEKKYLKDEIISFEKISYLMQALPPDMMFILRASNMIAIHNATLGGQTRTRLKKFTYFALSNLYSNQVILFFVWWWFLAKIFLFERYFYIYSRLFGMTSSETNLPCSHCNKLLPPATIPLHEAYCFRNMIKCADCNEMIDKTDNQSHKKQHEKSSCLHCNEFFTTFELEAHKIECPKKPQTCEFCRMEYPVTTFKSHQIQCGSRTQLCDICGKYIQMRDFNEHEQNCLTLMSLNDGSQSLMKSFNMQESQSQSRSKVKSFPNKEDSQNMMKSLMMKPLNGQKKKIEISSDSGEEYLPDLEEQKSLKNHNGNYETRKKKTTTLAQPKKPEAKERLRKHKKITSYEDATSDNEEEVIYMNKNKPNLKKVKESPIKNNEKNQENRDFEIARLLQEQFFQEEAPKNQTSNSLSFANSTNSNSHPAANNNKKSYQEMFKRKK